MSRTDAHITVTCDECGGDWVIELCALAHPGSWDERYVNDKLREWDWKVDNDKDICDSCVLEMEQEAQ